MTKEELKQKIEDLKIEIANLDYYQTALKIMMNAEYGGLGNNYFRYYDLRLASAVTLSGQLAIRWIENYLMNHPLQKKYKWEVIYSDTDSIYVSIQYLVSKLQEKITDKQQLLDKIIEFTKKIVNQIVHEGYEKLYHYMNCNENRMVMKTEKVIESCIWTGKKKYAMMVWDDEGVRYKEPRLKVKGFEIVKSSTPKVCRDALKKSVEYLLTDTNKLIDFIDKEKNKFFKMSPEQIAFPRGCNNLVKYQSSRTLYRKGTPIHVRAALVYNNFIKQNKLESQYPLIQEGEKIKFIFLRMPNVLHENVVGFIKHFPKELIEYIDYPMMWQKAFFSSLDNIQERIITDIKFKKHIDLNSLFEGE